jgi:hypothetical protein
MRTVLSEDPRREHRQVGKSDAPSGGGLHEKWYSTAYLSKVFAKRPAQMLALLAFVAIAGTLIYVFAAGAESTDLAFSGGTRVNTTFNSTAGTVSLNTATTGVNHAAQCGGETGSGPTVYDHVIVIMMENHSYSTVIGHAPTYIDPVLARQCGVAANMKDTISSNSTPHYMKYTSGNAVPLSDCSSSSSSCRSSSDNIFHQLGSGWSEYMEDMSHCGSGSTGYAARHDPASIYTDINGPSCPAAIKSFPASSWSSRTGALYTDLQNNTMSKFNFISPNTVNDMHDSGVAPGDTWLSHWIPIMLNSPTYTRSNTAIFVWWDEGDSGAVNQSLPNFTISPWTGNVRPTATYDECTAFHMLEDMVGVSNLACTKTANESSPGAASISPSVRSLFNL